MSNLVLQITNLEKRFPGREPLFSGLDLEVEEGTFHIIHGRSGTGKSTLLQILLGFETADHGTIEYVSLNPDDARKPDLSMIGYMSQSNMLLPEFTLLENITLRLFDKFNWEERVEMAFDMMRELGISSLNGRYIHQVSGGELRRANLAFTLVGVPKLLLLDEPTSNLHSELAKGIFNLIDEMTKEMNIAVIMTTHNRALISKRAKYYELERRDLVTILEET